MKKSSFVRFDKSGSSPGKQYGATLIVGLIMLVLITLIVLNAFNLSSSNLKSVGNMQMHDETVAAANQAVEQLISSITPSSTGSTSSVVALATAAQIAPTAVDINNDSQTDFSVQPVVTCIRAIKAAEASASDVEMGAAMSTGAYWNVDFDIKATVVDAASGARVETHQGIRLRLSESDKDSACL